MQHYEFHPAADRYPLMPDPELQALIDDMRENGYDHRFPIQLYQGRIADGRNRYHAAQKADVEPTYKNLPDSTDVEAFVERANEHRRHLTPDWLKANRKVRVKRVAEARKEGQSTRTIAEAEGVSQPQVLRDLKKATDTGVSVEPTNGQVHTANGRVQTATPAKPEKKLCDGCAHNRRIGRALPKSCPACADLNRKPKGEKKPKKDKNAPSGDKDAFGNEVPKRCRDVLFDPWVEQTIDLLGTGLDKILAARIADGMRKRQKRMPHFNADDVVDGIRFIQQYMEQVIGHLRDHRPAAVCPGCQGKGCGGCLMSGLVSKIDYEVLTEKA